MASAKQRLQKISDALAKRYGEASTYETDEFLILMCYLILATGADGEQARETLEQLLAEYVDWNDMRMATVREVEDLIGEGYPRRREKAEDIVSLLVDMHTAFRSSTLAQAIRTAEGQETLRALPETTLVRGDLVEEAMVRLGASERLPADEEQLELLAYLLKDEGADLDALRQEAEETLTVEERLQLAFGLRQHRDLIYQYNVDEPQPIGYGWDKKDPLGMKVPKDIGEMIGRRADAPAIVLRPADATTGQQPIPLSPAAQGIADPKRQDPKEKEKIIEELLAGIDTLDESSPATTTADFSGVTELRDGSAGTDTASNDPPTAVLRAVEEEAGEAESSSEAAEEPAASAPEEPAPAAEEPVEEVPAKDAPSKKAAAKKAPAKKSAAKKDSGTTKKAAAKSDSGTTKKAPAKKAAAAKESGTTKKAPAKKAAAKKAPAKKTAAAKESGTTKKAPAKKAAAKKAPAKKKAAPKKK